MKTTNRIMNRGRLNPSRVCCSMLVLSLAAGICGFAWDCRGQHTLTITFENPPIPTPGNGLTSETYLESGMEFRVLGSYLPGGGVVRFTSGYWAHPDNGTTYLLYGAKNALAFSLISSDFFDLVSVDLAEGVGTVGPVAVQFTGYRHDGSTVTNIFTTDGIMDGTGPLNDFETFHFGAEFSNLLRVEIPTSYWALDNLVFSIVPEPNTLALLSSGLLLWALSGRRKV